VNAAPRGFLAGSHHRRDLGVRGIGDVAQSDRSPLLGRQLTDARPQLFISRLGGCARLLREVGDEDGDAASGSGVVDRFSVGDRQDPAPQVGGIAQSWVGSQRGQPRLLIAVIGSITPNGGDEEPMNIPAVGVEHALKGGELHCR